MQQTEIELRCFIFKTSSAAKSARDARQSTVHRASRALSPVAGMAALRAAVCAAAVEACGNPFFV